MRKGSLLSSKFKKVAERRGFLGVLVYIAACKVEIRIILNSGISKFETLIWPITDTECQIWAKSEKLSFLTLHIFYVKTIRKKWPLTFYFN